MTAAKVSLRVWNLAHKLLKLFNLKSYGEAKTLSPLDSYRNYDRNLGKSLYCVDARTVYLGASVSKLFSVMTKK